MAVPAVQVDPVFEGLEGGPGSLVKFNPLTNATSQEVWDFLRVMGTPVNKLHEMGYVSIGCAPCTRAVFPGQQEREGEGHRDAEKRNLADGRRLPVGSRVGQLPTGRRRAQRRPVLIVGARRAATPRAGRRR